MLHKFDKKLSIKATNVHKLQNTTKNKTREKLFGKTMQKQAIQEPAWVTK